MSEIHPNPERHPGPELDVPDPQHDSLASTSRAVVVRNQNNEPGTLRKYLYSGFVGVLALSVSFYKTGTAWLPFGPSFSADDYVGRTRHVLSTTPMIDGHNDLPYVIRQELKNKINGPRFDFKGHLLSHTDLNKLRAGQLGGQFWSVFIECREEGVPQLEDPTWIVRDTLEQIDVIKRLITQQSTDLQYCGTPSCIRSAFASRKIASMIGIEGSHQLGNSIAVLRQMFELGARYLTITHNCDTPFATAATSVAAGKDDNGLTQLGQHLVEEMNRLGMLLDISHVSPQTMRDVLKVTKAPVMFSHSGAYSVTRYLRNAPDDVLLSLKSNGGVIMAPFVRDFLNKDHPEDATIHDVVDHIFYIAELIGWEHVGLGSDFDGTDGVARGLENTSKYPDLVQLVMRRGATDQQVRLLVGENILRVWAAVEKHAQNAQRANQLPVEEVWSGRKWCHDHDYDLPMMFRDSKKDRRESD